jgi:peptidoglycan/xylan/chitin deacetylase (PgdA/CDA1 family)
MDHRVSILMYHQVGRFAPMHAHRSTYCDHRRFAAQMAMLHHLGYRVLRLEEALACLAGRKPVPPRAVVLTFDDGYENFYEYAWPALQRYGFTAVVYLISDLVGKPSSWFARDGRDTPMLMDGPRIRQLHAAGIEFGAHSMSHVKLAEQTTERIRQEVSGCKRALEDILGAPVLDFCYPYGSHDMRAVEAVAEAGYRSGVTCEKASASGHDDPLTLPRKAISYGDSLAGVWWKLHMKHDPKVPPLRRPQYALSA